jgi:hypothetical protein
LARSSSSVSFAFGVERKFSYAILFVLMLKTSLLILGITIFAPIALRAATLVSSDGSSFTGWIVIFADQGYRIGWNTDAFAENVSVSAWLTAFGTNQTGRAYLTRTIGTGTSVLDEVASTSFTFPQTASELTLFSGLQLSSGQYYLSIIGDSPSFGSGWVIGNGIATESASTEYLGNFGSAGPIGSYFPATASYLEEGASVPGFSVQGTIPEPNSLALVIAGSVWLVQFRVKRKPNHAVERTIFR